MSPFVVTMPSITHISKDLLKECLEGPQSSRLHLVLVQGIRPQWLISPGIQLEGITIPKEPRHLLETLILGIVADKGVDIHGEVGVEIWLFKKPGFGGFYIGADILAFGYNAIQFVDGSLVDLVPILKETLW